MKSIYNKEYIKFIEKLKAARQQAGMTQTALANKLKTDQSLISKIESRERRLDIIEARMICRALKLDFSQFVREFEQEKK